MTDPLKAIRGKMRLIAEFRYPVIPRVFDVRGHLIEAVHPVVKERFPRWVSREGAVLFVDDPEHARREFLISSKQVSVILEDPGTVQEFEDQVVKCIDLAYDSILKKSCDRLERCGVRFVQVLKMPGFLSFDALNQGIVNKFCAGASGLPLEFTDSLVRLVHRRGSFMLGPIREGEPWAVGSFQRPDASMPAFGLGLDVDSYAQGVTIRSAADVRACFKAVQEVTFSVERDVASRLGVAIE